MDFGSSNSISTFHDRIFEIIHPSERSAHKMFAVFVHYQRRQAVGSACEMRVGLRVIYGLFSVFYPFRQAFLPEGVSISASSSVIKAAIFGFVIEKACREITPVHQERTLFPERDRRLDHVVLVIHGWPVRAKRPLFCLSLRPVHSWFGSNRCYASVSIPLCATRLLESKSFISLNIFKGAKSIVI